jgi:hypothetical protein
LRAPAAPSRLVSCDGIDVAVYLEPRPQFSAFTALACLRTLTAHRRLHVRRDGRPQRILIKKAAAAGSASCRSGDISSSNVSCSQIPVSIQPCRMQSQTDEPPAFQRHLRRFLAGACSGTLTAAALQPFDVIRTTQQGRRIQLEERAQRLCVARCSLFDLCLGHSTVASPCPKRPTAEYGEPPRMSYGKRAWPRCGRAL